MTTFDKAWALLKMPLYETDVPGLKFATQGENEPAWADNPDVHGTASFEGDTEMWTPNDFMQYWAKPNAKTPAHWKDVSRGNTNPTSSYYGLENPATAREVGINTYKNLNVGEDENIWGMPFLSFEEGQDQPNWHDGRHRMSELIESGYGDTPVPIRVDRSGRHQGVNRERYE